MQPHTFLRDPVPHIPLQTRSQTPIQITNLQLTQTEITNLTNVMAHPNVNQRLQAVPAPYTETDAKAFIKIQLGDEPNALKELPMTCIRAGDPVSGDLIGRIGLASRTIPGHELSASPGAYVVGYSLHPDWQGKGIMTAALRAVAWWAFEHMDAKLLIVRVAEDNVGSTKVVEHVREFREIVGGRSEDDWPASKGGGKKWLRMWEWKKDCTIQN